MNYRRGLQFCLLASTLGPCGWSQDGKYAPLPDRIVTARTAFLQTDTGEQKFADNMFRQLEEWGRWRVVTSRSEADLVLSLDHKDKLHNNFYLRVIDRESGETLWTAKKDVQIGTLRGVAKALLSDLRKRLPARAETK